MSKAPVAEFGRSDELLPKPIRIVPSVVVRVGTDFATTRAGFGAALGGCGTLTFGIALILLFEDGVSTAGTAGGVARETTGGGGTVVGRGGAGLGAVVDSLAILGGGGTTVLRTFGAEGLGCAIVDFVGADFGIVRADCIGAGGLRTPMAGFRTSETLGVCIGGFAMEGAGGTGFRLMAAMAGASGVCAEAFGVAVPPRLTNPFGRVSCDRGGLVGGGSNPAW